MILPLPSPQYEIIPKILQKFSPKNPTLTNDRHIDEMKSEGALDRNKIATVFNGRFFEA